MRNVAMSMIATVWILILVGCGSHELTSSPPGAAIYTYQASGRIPIIPGYPHWRRSGAPAPDQMRQAMASSRPIVTPHTFEGGPFDHWYQVRKEGYLDSEIIFLESRESGGTLSHHFVLKKRPDASEGE